MAGWPRHHRLRVMFMRKFLAIALAIAVLPATASALPRLTVEADRGAIAVQNRFLPGFLGGGGNNDKAADDAVRIQQLESQVRMLTGQVEQLTFTVRDPGGLSASDVATVTVTAVNDLPVITNASRDAATAVGSAGERAHGAAGASWMAGASSTGCSAPAI